MSSHLPRPSPTDLFRQATPEEWACFEGHAIGRVLDDEPPTDPEFVAPDARPTDPVLPTVLPDWAIDAIEHESLGLGPCDSTPPPVVHGSFDATVPIPLEALVPLLRRSSA